MYTFFGFAVSSFPASSLFNSETYECFRQRRCTVGQSNKTASSWIWKPCQPRKATIWRKRLNNYTYNYLLAYATILCFILLSPLEVGIDTKVSGLLACCCCSCWWQLVVPFIPSGSDCLSLSRQLSSYRFAIMPAGGPTFDTQFISRAMRDVEARESNAFCRVVVYSHCCWLFSGLSRYLPRESSQDCAAVL